MKLTTPACILLILCSISSHAKMNIVFFLADDLGYKDIVALRNGATDGPTIYETPAMDQLASQGISFTQAYCSGPRCVNARTSLMTGKYHFRPGVQSGGIDTSEYTLGEAFQAGGYKTCYIGKWHLGGLPDHADRMPVNQGFDVSIAAGEEGAPSTYFSPYNLPDLTDGPAGEYLTDRLTVEARNFISNHVSVTNQPFFLMLAHYAVHTPLEAKTNDIQYFETKKAGTDFNSHPMGTTEYTNDYTGRVKVRQDHTTYAAMVKSLDDSLQGILDELDAQGIASNTIIVVSSDHGGKSVHAMSNTDDAGIPTSNYPLRLGKGWVYEGGLRIPLIIRWPGNTPAGTTTDALVNGTDFYATFLDMAELPPISTQHLDSISFANVLTNSAGGDRTRSYHFFTNAKEGTGNPAFGVYREGDYKLIHFFVERFSELYNIPLDESESNNLLTTQPTVASNYFDIFYDTKNALGLTFNKPGNNSWAITTNLLSYIQTIPSPPTAPASLNVTPLSSSSISLSWNDNSNNEDVFIIERKLASGGGFVEIGVVSSNVTTFIDTFNLDPNTAYKYRVQAQNLGGWGTSAAGPQTVSTLVESMISIDLNSTNLYVGGAHFANVDANGLNFHRFDNTVYGATTFLLGANPVKAKTTTGAKLSFYTKSENIKLSFITLTDDENRGSDFAVYQNGTLAESIHINSSESNFALNLTNQAPGTIVKFDIALPSWANPILSKFEIDPGEILESGFHPFPRKRCINFGDSISHGTGQASASYLTWPWNFAEKMNMEMFNLAIGGGKISHITAELLQHWDTVDLITIMVGYNDWYNQGKTVAEFKDAYDTLVDIIRTNHPNAKLFCVTPPYTTNLASKVTGLPFDGFRTSIVEIVCERYNAGDPNIYHIKAHEFTDAGYLREDNPTDPVHFGTNGAAMFANDLFEIVNPYFTPQGTRSIYDYNYPSPWSNTTSFVDGEITLDGYGGEALRGRAKIDGFTFGSDASFSFQCAFKSYVLTSGQQRLFRMYNNTTSIGLFAGLRNGKTQLKINNATSVEGTTTIGANEWHVLGVSWNALTDTAKVYMDGIEENSLTLTDEKIPDTVTGITFATIGLTDVTVDNILISDAPLNLSTSLVTGSYADWAATFAWMGELQQAPNDDPDADGLVNFLEYAFSKSPIVSDNDGILKISHDNGEPSVSFILGKEAADLQYELQFSTNLFIWNSIAGKPVPSLEGEQASMQLNPYQTLPIYTRLITESMNPACP